MMSTPNKTLGQQFLEVLNIAKSDKSKMFMLLRSTLEKINPFPSEKVNFPADPEIHGRWEWAGIYFGEKL